MDDQCIFVTDQGEVAIYSGIDPSSASTWSLQGVYDAGDLVLDQAIPFGGDLLLATVSGLVRLSGLIRHDKATEARQALSAPIREWTDLVKGLARGQYITTIRDDTFLYFATTNGLFDKILVMNVATGAWSTITGWNAYQLGLFDGVLHFGNLTGDVFKTNIGGTDAGSPFTCTYVSAFIDPSPMTIKVAGVISAEWQHSRAFNAEYSVSVDHQLSLPSAPIAAEIPADESSFWGVATWGVSHWNTDYSTSIKSKYAQKSAHATGRSFAVAVRVVSASELALDCELLRTGLSITQGQAVAA